LDSVGPWNKAGEAVLTGAKRGSESPSHDWELVCDGKLSSSYGVIWIVRSPPSADFDGEYEIGVCWGSS